MPRTCKDCPAVIDRTRTRCGPCDAAHRRRQKQNAASKAAKKRKAQRQHDATEGRELRMLERGRHVSEMMRGQQ